MQRFAGLPYRTACLLAAGFLLVSCASMKSTFSSVAGAVGGAFGRVKATVLPGEDGAPDNAPADIMTIPDAVPRAEPLHPKANQRSAGDLVEGPFSQRGHATWYGRRHQGAATASDEKFDPLAMTAAHPRLPIPSYARVANVRTTKSVIVRINDRGPAERSVIALSYAAAAKLGIATPEGGEVEVTRIMPDEYGRLQAEALAAQRSTIAVAPVAAVRAPAASSAPVTPAGSPAAVPIPAPPAPRPSAAPVAPVAPVEPAPAVNAPAARTGAAPRAPATSRGTLTIAGSPAAAAQAPTTAPAAAPPAAATTTRGSAGPAATTRSAGAAATAASAASPGAAGSPGTGRWTIQVGVFAVPENAETVRRQVASQLAASLGDAPQADRTPRVEKRGNRHFVLVGDLADRGAADALAARVRRALKHDVVIVKR